MTELLKEFEQLLDKEHIVHTIDPFLEQGIRKFASQMGSYYSQKYSADHNTFIHKVLTSSEILKLLRFVEKEYMKICKLPHGAKKEDIDELIINLKRGIKCEHRFSDVILTLHLHFPELYQTFFAKLLAVLKKRKVIKRSLFSTNLNIIKKTFKLNDKEADILSFFYLVEICSYFESYFISEMHMNDLIKSSRHFCRLFDLTPSEFRTAISKTGPLFRSGLLKKNRQHCLELESSVAHYLSGSGELDLISLYVTEAHLKDALEIEDHNLSKDKIQNTLQMAQTSKGSNILLYGRPGTGKTEFAKSLGKTLGKNVFFVTQKDEDGEENLDHRKSAIVAAQNVFKENEVIIVIDECDKIVNSKESFWSIDDKNGDKKAWINDLLETNRHTLVWISNQIDNIDESTKRRFSYSVEFTDLGQKQRLKVWEKQISLLGIDFIAKEDLVGLSKTFKVNAGGISLALSDISSIPDLASPREKMETLKKTLLQHEQFVFGSKPKLASLSSTYELNVLNTDKKITSLIDLGHQFLDHIRVNSSPEMNNLNLLLQGPPGTGKTEFVKYLAENLGVELIIKRLSDIRSAWYGESLKNIAKMFNEAQMKESILFLDEADTFFTDRQSSHEHYKAETNELLTQMENFKGILVCATNFGGSMDPAVMRRFNQKVRFDYMNDEGKKSLFEKMLSPLANAPLNEAMTARINSIPALTPGDYKVVRQNNLFQTGIDTMSLIQQLENEVSYKKNVSKPVKLV